MDPRPEFLRAQATIARMCRTLRRIQADVLPIAIHRLASSARRCSESRERRSRDRLFAPIASLR